MNNKDITTINHNHSTDDFHFVRCVKCGWLLCKETSTYRFNCDGKPICYECFVKEA